MVLLPPSAHGARSLSTAGSSCCAKSPPPAPSLSELRGPRDARESSPVESAGSKPLASLNSSLPRGAPSRLLAVCIMAAAAAGGTPQRVVPDPEFSRDSGSRAHGGMSVLKRLLPVGGATKTPSDCTECSPEERRVSRSRESRLDREPSVNESDERRWFVRLSKDALLCVCWSTTYVGQAGVCVFYLVGFSCSHTVARKDWPVLGYYMGPAAQSCLPGALGCHCAQSALQLPAC